MNESVAMLSKWWMSESCKRAFERVEKARKERIAKLVKSQQAKQEQLKRDVENWREC